MCGIIGYIGDRQAQPILLNGLRRLEYRGYDSAGICTLLENKKNLSIRKFPGKIKGLEQLLQRNPLSGSLGIGHCLTPDTYILLSDGRIKKIAELNNQHNVVSVNLNNLKCGSSKKIKVFRHKSPSFLYKVKTPYFSFHATGEHRLFVAEPSGEIIEKRIKEITDELIAIPCRLPVFKTVRRYKLKQVQAEKHFIVTFLGRIALREHRKLSGYGWEEIKRSTGVNSTYIKRIEKGERASIEENRLRQILKCYQLSFSQKLFKSRNYITNDVVFPKSATRELMQIIGYFLGDGHMQERMIRFKEADRKICKIYQGLFARVFNIGSNLKEKKRYFVFTLNSRFLADWFKGNFPGLKPSSSQKDLPEFAGCLPSGQIGRLLRGLFDAEGSIGMHSGQISLGMTSRNIIEKTQLLLLRLGILSTFSKSIRRVKNWNNVYRLSINSKESMARFYKKVGFSSLSKQRQLLFLIKRKKKLHYKHFYLPVRLDSFYKSYLKPTKIRGWSTIGLKPRKTYLTSYRLNKITAFLRREEKTSADKKKIREALYCVKKFINSDLVWVRPEITIVPSSDRFVYDLEVKPASNFVGNGIIQHNSRWATHGAPNQVNAHPHYDCKNSLAIVHNGIIENFETLKASLIKEGHIFRTQTDTEVIAHLIEKFYKHVPLEEAVRKALKLLVGTFALGVISQEEPDKLVGARSGSPLIVGVGRGENFLASDVSAVLESTKEVIFLEEDEVAVLSKDKIIITDLQGKPVNRKTTRVSWDITQAQKQGFPHFMLKEINEQPGIIENLLAMRIDKATHKITFKEQNIPQEKLRKIKNAAIVACGTAYHAGIAGKYILEEICGLPVSVDVSSEFRYRKLLIGQDTLVIAISQSGETADTLAGIRQAKKLGALVLSLCNVLGSTLDRESDGVIYTHAGPEIGVASTKAYTAQLASMYMLGFYLANIKNTLPTEKINHYLEEMRTVPKLQEQVLKNQKLIAALARRHSNLGSFLFLGRNINYPSALEGALKLKEISYIPAEGYAAGEMKHGPIALIDEYRAVVCIATESRIYQKMISNIQEIRARKGKLIIIATQGDTQVKNLSREVIYTPKINELFSPLIVALPLQLLAYHIALKRGCDVDQPRNLAKSVTVE